MDAIIYPVDALYGTIEVPPSKSYTQRALAASLLVETLHLKNIGKSEDEKAALSIIEACGVAIEWLNETEIITHRTFDFNTELQLNCGESGLSARLFSTMLLLNRKQTTIEGVGTLLSRPMQPLAMIYEQLGVEYTWNEGKLPLSFTGKHNPQNIKIDGSLSSQFITGLIYYMVGLNHNEPLYIEIDTVQSRPYINMTIDLLNQLGANIQWQGNTTLIVNPSQLLHQASITIESDWSSAACWVAAAAISGDITLKGLNPQSLQADRAIIDVARQFGASISIKEEEISIKNKGNNAFQFDATHCPDLIPILMVMAVFSKGETMIQGVERLINKESNRLHCMIFILKSLHILHKHLGNFIKIKGNDKKNIKYKNTDIQEFNSFSDHRIAMALSILASFLIPIKVKDFNVVAKSYPELSRDMVLLHSNLKVI